MKAFNEDTGSSPPSLVQATSSGRQSGVMTAHAEDGLYTGALVPSDVPSEAVMLLCTAGPTYGLPAELGLVSVFILLSPAGRDGDELGS